MALARTLAVGPRILLLDEPLAALDKNLRLDMQIEIRQLQRRLAITTVMVTHDQDEALSMADTVAVMNRGRLEQSGTPAAIYDQPDTAFVASFVGTANMLPAVLVQQGGSFALELPGGALPIEPPRPVQRSGAVLAAIRPEHWALDPLGPLPATVALAMPLGPRHPGRPGAGRRHRRQADAAARGGRRRRSRGQGVRLRLRPGAAIRVFPSSEPE